MAAPQYCVVVLLYYRIEERCSAILLFLSLSCGHSIAVARSSTSIIILLFWDTFRCVEWEYSGPGIYECQRRWSCGSSKLELKEPYQQLSRPIIGLRKVHLW